MCLKFVSKPLFSDSVGHQVHTVFYALAEKVITFAVIVRGCEHVFTSVSNLFFVSPVSISLASQTCGPS